MAEATAREDIGFESTYSPLRSAAEVGCPLLVQVASDDAVTPPGPARKVAERAPRGALLEYPGGHFAPYVEPLFERVIADQLAFLKRNT
jgi:pimeloyl-ACP methyl ester carboxylesterase